MSTVKALSVLEKTLGRPLDCKEIQPVHLKGNQSWIFIGRIDVEAEAPILWPPEVKSWLIGRDPDARKDWGQKEKRAAENEMVGWYHWLNAHEFEQTPGVSQFSSVTQSCPSLCDPMDCSTPGLPVHHQLSEFTSTHVHSVGDPTFSSSVIPFSSCLQSSPASGSLQMNQLFTSGQSIGVSALT